MINQKACLIIKFLLCKKKSTEYDMRVDSSVKKSQKEVGGRKFEKWLYSYHFIIDRVSNYLIEIFLFAFDRWYGENDG